MSRDEMEIINTSEMYNILVVNCILLKGNPVIFEFHEILLKIVGWLCTVPIVTVNTK